MPTKEHVQKALNKIHRTVDYNFFFENLNSPDWLEPLDDLKLFDDPWEPQRVGNSVRYPFWPQAKYLIKIASEKSDKVMEIILKIRATQNPRVHEDFVEAALKMPPSISVKLYKKIIEWINLQDTNFLLLPSKIATYVVHINEGGFKEQALQITDVLLGLKKFVRQLDGDNNIKRADPIIRSEWEYKEIIKKITPSFHNKDKVELIKILTDKLSEAIHIEEGEEHQEFVDFSHIWRSSIEDSSQNHDCMIKDTIINAIRDLSEELLMEAPELIESLCEYFRKGIFPIFSRFALHLARLTMRADLSSKFILDQQLFNCMDVWHEYALLLEFGYSLLSENDKNKFLAMIAGDVANKNKNKASEDINDEDNQKARYLYYYMIRLHLTGDAKKIFESLYSKFGDLEHPTFHGYTSTWVGPISPIQEDEMRALPILELKKFLDEWSAPERWNFGPSIEGLGRQLEKVVSERANDFIDHINEFKVQEKTYVRSIIQGFSKAFDEKKALEWVRVIEYLLWASDQADESDDDVLSPAEEKDPSWSWTRLAACRLLERGLASETNELPFLLREKVWRILSLGLSDVHPNIEEEQKYTSDKNYYQTAINSVRGVALEASIHYAFWVKRNLGLAKGRLPIEKAPEFFKTLDNHLNIKTENSRAVRSVYGRWIPCLWSLNREWFQEKKKLILPLDDVLRDYWSAAWDANILYNQPYTDVFRDLRNEYVLAIDRIELTNANKTGQRLVEHIIGLYLCGEFGLYSDILDNLYTKLDMRLKKRVIDMIGRNLGNEKHPPDPKVVQRAVEFWNFRVEECKKLNTPEDRMELAEFGWWLKSDHLNDDEWSLDQTIEVLKLCHFLTPDHMVIERLLELVDKYPTKVAEVLRLMVEHRVTDYGFYGWLEEAEVLLFKLLVTDAKETAVKIIHKLGAYGFNQFGVLLKKNTDDS